MKINTNSWHYKFLAYTGVMRYYSTTPSSRQMRFSDDDTFVKKYQKLVDMDIIRQPMTFCQYWRDILLYTPLTFLINAGVATIVAYLLFSIISFSDVLGFSAFVIIAGLILASCVGIGIGISKILTRVKENTQTPDSFFNGLYQAHKEKVCTIMEYDNGKD